MKRENSDDTNCKEARIVKATLLPAELPRRSTHASPRRGIKRGMAAGCLQRRSQLVTLSGLLGRQGLFLMSVIIDRRESNPCDRAIVSNAENNLTRATFFVDGHVIPHCTDVDGSELTECLLKSLRAVFLSLRRSLELQKRVLPAVHTSTANIGQPTHIGLAIELSHSGGQFWSVFLKRAKQSMRGVRPSLDSGQFGAASDNRLSSIVKPRYRACTSAFVGVGGAIRDRNEGVVHACQLCHLFERSPFRLLRRPHRGRPFVQI
mmetsp:Transcript_4248/g.12980  ORF Transcript_4248/g.12980 Transcript_4248/m.12980 type:complete len:263 (-) Transcript_4248:2-790(-)